MQEGLKINKLKDKIISLDEYKQKISGNSNTEFILYADNVLEGISLMNSAVISTDDILTFCFIVYEPIDQPIYVFQDKLGRFYSLKICGSFFNWNLPDDVHNIESFIDIPDFAIYSVTNKKTIIAGETTETASVGNSQWQREGRKIGSARNKVPFIYQTFYSGKDESLDRIREPTSLQVYNHLLYSIRYKIPSFVIYFDNNFENGNTARIRKNINGAEIFIKYIKATLVVSVDSSLLNIKKELEKSIYRHMLAYILEGRAKNGGTIENEARILKDFPIINTELLRILLNDSEKFISELVDYINDDNSDQNDFTDKYNFTKFNDTRIKNWNSYTDKKYIRNLLFFLKEKNIIPYSYASKSKICITKTYEIFSYLRNEFPDKLKEIEKIFSGYDEAVIIPLRIHKTSNDILTFCPDPESGEIAAFAELFGYDSFGNKIRPVLGYCIVDTPNNFDLNDKKDTKLYRSIANYVDFLVINGSQVYTSFKKHENYTDMYLPEDIASVNQKGLTEEVAIVSTFLGLSTIKADWDLCFIHTHHSSWQQLMVYKDKIAKRMKINRISSKVDLVMQNGNDLFFIAEGKKKYSDFFASATEIQKIKKGMEDTDKNINSLLNINHPKIYSFVCLIEVPEVNTDFFLNNSFNLIEKSIKEGHLDVIVQGNFVVIAVYIIKKETMFKIFFSNSFSDDYKKYFTNVFGN